MKPQAKTEVVESLRERLARATITILAEPRGLNVAEVTALRRKMRGIEGEYKIAKNTLTIRAVDQTDCAPLSSMLEGPTALVFGYGDPVAVAKEFVAYASQSGEKLSIKGAVLDGQLFGGEEVKALAKLEGKDALRAKLLGVLQAPAGQLVRLLNEPAASLARALSARAEAGAPAE